MIGSFSNLQPSETKKKETILEEAEKIVGGDRENVYGHPADDFTCIARMWSAYLTKTNRKDVFVSPFDIANMMIMVKVARLATSPNHRDSKVDIAGYARCSERIDDFFATAPQVDRP